MHLQNSLSWIEWLDRLDRVLAGARQDVRALVRQASPLTLEAVERCCRQLSSLTNELRLLDPRVLTHQPGLHPVDVADGLRRALDTTVFQLGAITNPETIASTGARERTIAAVDSALRDSSYEAAILLEPSKRRA
jgi:hypothetical protein